jgi:ABC-2 type transport system ATP-binding protein
MLTVSGLCKAYGGHSVLKELHLSLPAGELYGLLGPNGAGKTTFLNILCCLVNADRGTILIDGIPHTRLPKGRIGISPQENLLYGSLTCAEHLAFFGSLHGLSQASLSNRITACLAAVGLGHRRDSRAETLSGGMQRRLNLAIALVHRPKLLILDEPTTGLDIESRHDLWELILNLQRQGMTILLTTHLLDEAERLCQRIGILQQGRLLAEGTIPQLRAHLPVHELAVIRTPQEERAIERAGRLGWQHRFYADELTLWLPEPLPLLEIARRFDGIPLEAIAIQPVRLEHLYLEITRQRGADGRNPDPSEGIDH